MITTAQMKSLLRASASYFGGAGSVAYKFLTLLLTNVGILGDTILLSNLAAQTTTGGGTGASTDRITFDGGAFIGDGFTLSTSNVANILEPGQYYADYSVTATDGAGGESLQLYINGSADGAAGAVLRSRSFVDYTNGNIVQLTGKAGFEVTAAMIAAGILAGGDGAILSLRAVGGVNVALPAIAATGHAVVGTNATIELRRVA